MAMLNSVTRIPSWLTAHWRGAALVACAIGAAAILRSHNKDPERAARMKEKDLQTLAERISKYAREMQARYPNGSVVVSEDDLAGALHRAPERIARALGLLQNQQKVERAPLAGYWKLNVE
ncbi:MAG TPA: hypothetical protein VFI60_04590 [Candidatus Acidoferrum sp.]|nr:hypothetical protein [Candidatus Acidoferrum sp.]